MGTWILLALCGCADLNADQHSVLGRALLTPPTVHVRIDQDGGLSRLQLRLVLEEIQSIWEPAGVAVTSGRYADPVHRGSAVVSLRVVGEQLPGGGQPTLGWVPADVDEQHTPIIFVSRPALNTLLAAVLFRGLPVSARPMALREELAARAIGRVAAHELGHYFLRARDHDARGLMRPHYSAGDLMAPSIAPFQIRAADRSFQQHEVARVSARR